MTSATSTRKKRESAETLALRRVRAKVIRDRAKANRIQIVVDNKKLAVENARLENVVAELLRIIDGNMLKIPLIDVDQEAVTAGFTDLEIDELNELFV